MSTFAQIPQGQYNGSINKREDSTLFGKIRNSKVFCIDFSRPWWRLIWKQKGIFGLILFMTMTMQIWITIIPFLATWMFESKQYASCGVLFLAWLSIELLQMLIRRRSPKFQLQCIYSIYESAHLHLLSVDPQYHVHRSSGAILGKIERAARGYEDLLDYITDDYVPLLGGVVTAIIVIALYSLGMALAIAGFILTILTGGYFFAKRWGQRWEKAFIRSDDAFKTTAVENLAQIQLIRSAFATNEQSEQLKRRVIENMKSEGALWLSYTSIFSVLTLVYLGSLFSLGITLMRQVNLEWISATIAIGIFLSYMQGTRTLIASVRLFRKSIRSLASIRDLFAFIPTFGKQEIPVFGGGVVVGKQKIIEIEAPAISFDYGQAALFNQHSFAMRISRKQENKLYGIIGPSGSGKSTLLSILGGQLKPIQGRVLIDGRDIYRENDAMRRQLIALQGQIATNLQGTVRSNLLLGLPNPALHSDIELLKIIEDVGLLPILTEGLETKIGEGGLNLSGGQRQRLNFASLFLRANHYRPDLILIDEPTSSLDEISEAKITSMLVLLAHHAVTLVIAHRLKTIEYAAGLIDLSLLSSSQEIQIYAPAELLKRSEYYRLLMQGKIELDR